MPAPKNQEVSIVSQLQSDNVKNALRAVLPKIMNADRFMSMAVAAAKVHAVSKYVTDKTSILLAVYNAAKMGLDLNEQMGHAYLVPFKGKVVLIPGYKGLVDLVRRSGQIADMKAFIVYQKEVELKQFEYWADENGQHFKYTPYFGEDKGDPVCGVSVAWFKDVGVKPSVEVMSWPEISKIKDAAVARTPSSPWANKMYEPEMAKKTVIRRHCKMLPCSADVALSRIIHDDESIERGEMPQSEELPDSLKSALSGDIEDAVSTPVPADEVVSEGEVKSELLQSINASLLKCQAMGKMAVASKIVVERSKNQKLETLTEDQLLVVCDGLEELIQKEGK